MAAGCHVTRAVTSPLWISCSFLYNERVGSRVPPSLLPWGSVPHPRAPCTLTLYSFLKNPQPTAQRCPRDLWFLGTRPQLHVKGPLSSILSHLLDSWQHKRLQNGKALFPPRQREDNLGAISSSLGEERKRRTMGKENPKLHLIHIFYKAFSP